MAATVLENKWKAVAKCNQYRSPYIGNDSDREWKSDFYFFQGADPQFGMKDAYGNPNYSIENADWSFEIEVAKLAVEKVNKMKPKPRFFVICGDLTNEFPTDSEELKDRQIADFKKVFSQVNDDIPLVCVCGNHDVGNSPTVETINKYRSIFGDDYFSFWCGGVLFIVLNSQFYWDPQHVEEMAREQDLWLDSQLKQTEASQIICFSHIPWFTQNADEEETIYNIPRTTRMRMLEKLYKAGVRYFFCGHYHRNGGGFYKETEIIVTSAIGCQAGPDKCGIRLVKVTKDRVEHSYCTFQTSPSSAIKFEEIDAKLETVRKQLPVTN